MNKLQRYKSKDYSLCVDFPVEIIGKDGIIRHYSFEESIGLYQRRIRIAQMKSIVDEIKEAEIDHCTKRIAQLRRSFYTRYGWEAFIFHEDTPDAIPNEVLGELSAYFRRRFGCGIHTQRAMLTLLDMNEDLTTISVFWESSQFLLYVPLTAAGSQNIKDIFSLHQNTNHTENVLDIVENEDFSFVLTSLDANTNIPTFDSNSETQSHSFLEAIQAIHNGNLLEAMGHFILAIDENPYQRGAYWGGAILAEQLRAHGENEIILTMARHYFPKDVGLLLRLSACKIRKMDQTIDDDVEGLLQQIEAMDPNIDVNLLYYLYSLQQKQHFRAKQYWKRLKHSKHPNLDQTVYWLEMILRRRRVGKQASFIFFILISLSFFNLFFLIFLPISIVIFLTNERYFEEVLRRALRGESYIQLSLIPSSDIVQQLKKSFSETSH